MFGGKTKRDLDEVIINLSKAYDFIEAYADSQESKKNTTAYETARDLQRDIAHCLLDLKSIDRFSWSDMNCYLEKFRVHPANRVPNKYTAVFINPDIPPSKEILSILEQIDIANLSPFDEERYMKPKDLLRDYCEIVNKS